MKSENTSLRLKKLMSEKNLKQVDILEKCKPFCEKYGITMNKSDISQYVSGKTEPGSKKLTILSLALGVTETWLMGYDVPMDREDTTKSVSLSQHDLSLKNYGTTSINSVERVKAICKERKIAISKLEKELGFSNGYISQLKKGVFPEDRLRKIAKYLNVSTEYLATGEETPTNSIEDLDGIYLSLAREAQENGLDPDDIKLAIETIKSIKRARGE